MRESSSTTDTRQPDAVLLAAATWLAAGGVLAALTPLPLHDATLGWSPLFWLLLAPALLLALRLTLTPAARGYAATPLRLASIRRSSSRMMR